MDFMDKVKEIIPLALYNKWTEKVADSQSALLNYIEALADAWEEINGKDLIWVPGYFEKAKRNLTQEEIEKPLTEPFSSPIYANKTLWGNREGE